MTVLSVINILKIYIFKFEMSVQIVIWTITKYQKDDNIINVFWNHFRHITCGDIVV